jgi:hypothetical protein
MSWPTDLPILKLQLERAEIKRVELLLLAGPLAGLNDRQKHESHFWVMGLRELASQGKIDHRWVELADWESQLRRLKDQGAPSIRGLSSSQVGGEMRFVEINPEVQFLRAEEDWSETLSGLGWWSTRPKRVEAPFLAAVVPYPGRLAGIHIMRSAMIEVLDLFQDGARQEKLVPETDAAAEAFLHLLRLEVLRRIPQEDWRITHYEACLTQRAGYMERGLLVTTAVGHLARGSCCKSMCRHCPWGYITKK